MHDLSAFQRDLLFTIASLDEPNGLEIKNELDEYYDDDINHGRLYPNLDELVDKGLVEKGTIDDRTNSYSVTRRGERDLTSRLEWERKRVESDMMA